jgi:hypothetical protein
MSDTKLLAGFEKLAIVRRQYKKHTGKLHGSQKLAAFRLLLTTNVERALHRAGPRA